MRGPLPLFSYALTHAYRRVPWGNAVDNRLYVPCMRTDLEYRELEDGGVIYDTSAERVHTLNMTAAYIWNCCDGSHDAAAIAAALHDSKQICPEQALNDVCRTLNYFRSEGLLTS